MRPHRVVIVGGGFAGLDTAKRLDHPNIDVTLLDRLNYHLFQPLLYQVATGGLSPGDISSPLRAVLKKHKNTRVWQANVVDVDVTNRRVVLEDGAVEYDTLVVATGVRHSYFGNDDWQPRAPGLKSIEDALDIRRRILLAFETAEREADRTRRDRLMTFVIVGGGPTGVELAGALAELAAETMRGDFRHIDTSRTRILLIEGRDRILPMYAESLSQAAARSLAHLGVEVRTDTMVTEIDRGVMLSHGGGTEHIDAETILWAAGVQASPLGRVLAERTGGTVDRVGRIRITDNLTLAGHDAIFVIGDLAVLEQDGAELPGVAPVAMQQGRYVAAAIKSRLAGKVPATFRYVDKGSLAVIGRHAAVADVNGRRFSGFPAWLAWLLIHIWYLIEFDSKLIVFTQWAFDYVTRKRGARLITGADPQPLVAASGPGGNRSTGNADKPPSAARDTGDTAGGPAK